MPKKVKDDQKNPKKKKVLDDGEEIIEVDILEDDDDDIDADAVHDELPPEVAQALNITPKKKKTVVIDDTDYVPELERGLLEDLAEAEADL